MSNIKEVFFFFVKFYYILCHQFLKKNQLLSDRPDDMFNPLKGQVY